MEQELAVRLVGGAGADRGQAGRVSLTGFGQAPLQAAARPRGGPVGRQRPADPAARRLQPAQQVIGLDLQCLRSNGAGDVRVAIAVAAHPAAQAQERRRHRRRHAGDFRLDGGVERAINVWHHLEEALVENGHHRPHLVLGLDLGAPELRGPPEQVNLLQQAALGLALLAGRERGIVEALELVAHPPDGRDHGPAAGLRGVGGEHRVHLQPGQRLPQALLPQRPAQFGHRRCQAVRKHGPTPVALPQRPLPLVLLGQVGEVEIAGEGARHLLSPLQRPVGDQPLRLHLHSLVLAGCDHGSPQALHVCEQLRSAPLA